MPSNPFLKPCKECGGSGQTGWFKKETCIPCGGTGYGEPNREYWYHFLHYELEMRNKETSASDLPHVESGIAAIEALLKAAPLNKNSHSWLLGKLYQSKGCILGDIAETQKNQHILFLESVEYLRKAEKLGLDDSASAIERILHSFRWMCSPNEQKVIENLYKTKYPNREIPS